MTTQQKVTNETQEMTAKNLLKDFLDQEGMRIEKLEAKTPREAVARVDLRQLGLRTMSAELADKNSGLWTKDSNPCHPYRFACSDGFPIPAAKMESLKKSYARISFSPDAQSAVMFLVEELAVFGKVVPAVDGKEAFYRLPLEFCGIGRVIEGKLMWRLPPGLANASGSANTECESRIRHSGCSFSGRRVKPIAPDARGCLRGSEE